MNVIAVTKTAIASSKPADDETSLVPTKNAARAHRQDERKSRAKSRV
jgi:hypothetical protein